MGGFYGQREENVILTETSAVQSIWLDDETGRFAVLFYDDDETDDWVRIQYGDDETLICTDGVFLYEAQLFASNWLNHGQVIGLDTEFHDQRKEYQEDYGELPYGYGRQEASA